MHYLKLILNPISAEVNSVSMEARTTKGGRTITQRGNIQPACLHRGFNDTVTYLISVRYN